MFKNAVHALCSFNRQIPRVEKLTKPNSSACRSNARLPQQQASIKRAKDHISESKNLFPIPACRFDMLDSLGRVGFCVVFVLGCEWIRILCLIKVSKRMVHLPVLCFVCSNVHQQVVHSLVALWHLPVADGYLWRLQGFPCRKSSLFDVFDGVGVSPHSLLFDIAHEAVTCLRRDKVRQEEALNDIDERSQIVLSGDIRLTL